MEKRPFIIGITGGSGSGKTSLLKQIRAKFSEHEVCIISQDDYYRPRDEQEIDEKGIKNFDLPKSIDKKAFAKDITLLINGHNIERLEYTFNNANAVPQKKILYFAPIIVVEGLFVLHFKQIKKLLDLKVYMHAKENLKVIRRIKRDQIERGYDLQDVLYRYQPRVAHVWKNIFAHITKKLTS